MAKKKKTEVVLDRIYTVPLRKGWRKAPKWKRSKRALTEIRNFMIKHLKTKDVKIGKEINETVWTKGSRNPPSRIKIHATKDNTGLATVNLFGVKKEEPKKEEKKEVKKEKKEDKKEKVKEEKKGD